MNMRRKSMSYANITVQTKLRSFRITYSFIVSSFDVIMHIVIVLLEYRYIAIVIMSILSQSRPLCKLHYRRKLTQYIIYYT